MLARAFSVHPNLASLDVACNPIGEQGGLLLLQAASTSAALRRLNLEVCATAAAFLFKDPCLLVVSFVTPLPPRSLGASVHPCNTVSFDRAAHLIFSLLQGCHFVPCSQNSDGITYSPASPNGSYTLNLAGAPAPHPPHRVLAMPYTSLNLRQPSFFGMCHSYSMPAPVGASLSLDCCTPDARDNRSVYGSMMVIDLTALNCLALVDWKPADSME